MSHLAKGTTEGRFWPAQAAAQKLSSPEAPPVAGAEGYLAAMARTSGASVSWEASASCSCNRACPAAQCWDLHAMLQLWWSGCAGEQPASASSCRRYRCCGMAQTTSKGQIMLPVPCKSPSEGCHLDIPTRSTMGSIIFVTAVHAHQQHGLEGGPCQETNHSHCSHTTWWSETTRQTQPYRCLADGLEPLPAEIIKEQSSSVWEMSRSHAALPLDAHLAQPVSVRPEPGRALAQWGSRTQRWWAA